MRDPAPHLSEQPDPPEAPPPASEPHSAFSVLREWFEALLIAFILAMFLRVFVVELFQIPTGSMTPTLIGGEVVEIDYNRDDRNDLLLLRSYRDPLLFLNTDGRLVAQGPVDIPRSEIRNYERTGRVRRQNDRIMVNKFAYWFQPPQIGDIVVFKVPTHIWEADKPIYIKRCTGRPTDRISFDAAGHLVVDGMRVTHPEFFQTQTYDTVLSETGPMQRQAEIRYEPVGLNSLRIETISVPSDEIYVFGDNTHGSLDSRHWGGVPLKNLKGRAFFRYRPLDQMKFLVGG